jgi:hypothetical protein
MSEVLEKDKAQLAPRDGRNPVNVSADTARQGPRWAAAALHTDRRAALSDACLLAAQCILRRNRLIDRTE